MTAVERGTRESQEKSSPMHNEPEGESSQTYLGSTLCTKNRHVRALPPRDIKKLWFFYTVIAAQRLVLQQKRPHARVRKVTVSALESKEGAILDSVILLAKKGKSGFVNVISSTLRTLAAAARNATTPPSWASNSSARLLQRKLPPGGEPLLSSSQSLHNASPFTNSPSFLQMQSEVVL